MYLDVAGVDYKKHLDECAQNNEILYSFSDNLREAFKKSDLYNKEVGRNQSKEKL